MGVFVVVVVVPQAQMSQYGFDCDLVEKISTKVILKVFLTLEFRSGKRVDVEACASLLAV